MLRAYPNSQRVVNPGDRQVCAIGELLGERPFHEQRDFLPDHWFELSPAIQLALKEIRVSIRRRQNPKRKPSLFGPPLPRTETSVRRAEWEWGRMDSDAKRRVREGVLRRARKRVEAKAKKGSAKGKRKSKGRK